MALKIGELAPDFELPSQTGRTVRLRDFRGRSVVLYFYPKDDTSACTKEACAFRDDYEDFIAAGAEVIGISSDPIDSHKSFASKYRLPFILLSDTGGRLRKLYGVSSTFGLLPGRVTYVIDKKGIVRHLFSSQLNPKKHVDEALRVLQGVSG